MDTYVAREARTLRFSHTQRMLLIGSLLGDGYLDQTTRGYSLRIHHGISQKEYVDFKYSLIKRFVNSSPRQSGDAYYFRTVSHPWLIQLRKQFYNGNQKILPTSFLVNSFDPFALAIWIMDDGTAEGNQLRINTQSFTQEENIWLTQFLQAKLGIETTVNTDKGKYRLRIKASSMQLLKDLVVPFTIPSMLYKLSL